MDVTLLLTQTNDELYASLVIKIFFLPWHFLQGPDTVPYGGTRKLIDHTNLTGQFNNWQQNINNNNTWQHSSYHHPWDEWALNHFLEIQNVLCLYLLYLNIQLVKYSMVLSTYPKHSSTTNRVKHEIQIIMYH